MAAGKQPDRSYHEKVVKGLLVPTWSYMTDSEAYAVMHGRRRSDGRHLDHWVLPEILDEDLEKEADRLLRLAEGGGE